MVAVVVEFTVVVVIVKLALALPLGIVTFVGTVATDVLLARFTRIAEPTGRL